MEAPGLFAGMDPKAFFRTEICSGNGKYLFTEKDYPRPGDVTKYYDRCPCKGFEPFQKLDLDAYQAI